MIFSDLTVLMEHSGLPDGLCVFCYNLILLMGYRGAMAVITIIDSTYWV